MQRRSSQKKSRKLNYIPQQPTRRILGQNPGHGNDTKPPIITWWNPGLTKMRDIIMRGRLNSYRATRLTSCKVKLDQYNDTGMQNALRARWRGRNAEGNSTTQMERDLMSQITQSTTAKQKRPWIWSMQWCWNAKSIASKMARKKCRGKLHNTGGARPHVPDNPTHNCQAEASINLQSMQWYWI